MWNSNVGERMDYENPRALPARVPESNYGSSGSIAAKNQGRKRSAEKAEETNLSGLSSTRMTRTERIWSPDTFIGFNELIKRIRAGRCGWAARCAYRCLIWHPNKKHRETPDNHLEENTCICVYHNNDPPISHDIYIMTRSSESTLGAIELAHHRPPLPSYPRWRNVRSCQTPPLNVLSSFTDPINVSVCKTTNFAT